MTNGRWKRGLQRIASTIEITQYIHLWPMLSGWQLGVDYNGSHTFRYLPSFTELVEKHD
jgi:hypothetical protein